MGIFDIFNKKKIVFTGDMSKSRAEMRATAIRYGADSPTSISGKTNMLVIDNNIAFINKFFVLFSIQYLLTYYIATIC